MRSWEEAYSGLQEFAGMARDAGTPIGAYLDGQAVVMYYGEEAGADVTYRETDDIDLLLRDPADLAVAEEYGFVFGGAGNIPLQEQDIDVDLLVDSDAVERLDAERQQYGAAQVSGLDPVTVYVPPPELFARKKQEVGRDKDVEDADRLEQIMAHHG